jgi:hypothetical protein
MSGIFDQIINYSPPLIVSGTVNYKGTWNASTNNPTLNDPPAASTKGDYYVVSTAGTQFSITFGVGDWIISNGTAWEKVDLTDAVHSVFGRTGAVVGDSTDYSAVGLTNTAIGASSPSTGAFTSLSSSSTTTLNGTTIPASKTLVVTTDKLSALAATTSAELAGVISDETGSGALVFATSPTLVTPILGTPQSGTVTNLTGTASININGTVGATTPSTGAFTTLSASGLITSTNSGRLFNRAGASTAEQYFQVANTGGDYFWGVNDSAAAFAGGTAYSSFRYVPTGRVIQDIVQGTAITTTSATGVAVTGALSTLATNGVNTFESAGVSSVGLQFRTNSNNRFKIETPSASADLAFYSAGTTEVARLSSTGLAVTGALSSTGQITSSRARSDTLGDVGLAFGAVSQWGWRDDLSNRANLDYYNGATWSNMLQVTGGTGLAVTGALSSTGALAIGNTVATAVSVASTHKVTIVIGGTTYYLLATNV